MASYAASKGGLVNLTRELAAQWARRGVRVNALAPGWFRTEMTEGRMFGDERVERWIRSRTPMGRGGDEHELDGALLFLAGRRSSFVTGSGAVRRRRMDGDLTHRAMSARTAFRPFGDPGRGSAVAHAFVETRLRERGGEILVDPLGVDVGDRVEADVPDAGTRSGEDS